MKKMLLVLFSSVLLFGCSSSDDDSGSSSYNPPTWIQGTWGLKADGTIYKNDVPLYKFTSDNVCQLTGGFSLCWKETIQQTPQVLSGSDAYTDKTYEAKLIQGNGATTTTLSFKKVSATTIIWVSQGFEYELEKLN